MDYNENLWLSEAKNVQHKMRARTRARIHAEKCKIIICIRVVTVQDEGNSQCCVMQGLLSRFVRVVNIDSCKYLQEAVSTFWSSNKVVILFMDEALGGQAERLRLNVPNFSRNTSFRRENNINTNRKELV